MGAKQPKVVRLGPPLSLRALGLTPESSVDEALRALLRSREEIQGLQQATDTGKSSEVRQRRGGGGEGAGSDKAPREPAPTSGGELPSRDRLYVLLDRGDGQEPEVLGGRFAAENAGLSLIDMGVAKGEADADACDNASEAAGGGEPTPRLCLAGPAAASGAPRRCSPCGPCSRSSRRACRRRLRSCWRRSSTRVWGWVPERWKASLQPMMAQWKFYILCARIALKFLWQDRHEMFKEFKGALFVDLWTPEGLPPCRSSQVADELRPFFYAVVAILLYALWDVSCKVISAPRPPMNMTLG